jgi:hypothetical protein
MERRNVLRACGKSHRVLQSKRPPEKVAVASS